ncbi:MAG: nicotinate (nicotinamide) nucleotide adenylyltransferase [Acholeplasmataceae bacterium]
MNIVYGGSFNPPTIAHQQIIKKLLDTFKDAKLIILPVGNDYAKPSLIDYSYRKDMILLLTKVYQQRIIISDLEQKQGFKGTIEALNLLSKTYDDLYFVLGSDNLAELDTWIEYKKLLKNYPIIVMNRNHYMTINEAEHMFKDLKHRFIFIDFNMDVSSTEIRSDIHKYMKLIPKEVYEYILKHRLYEG